MIFWKNLKIYLFTENENFAYILDLYEAYKKFRQSNKASIDSIFIILA